MKSQNCLYVAMLSFSLVLSSCVSYEISSSKKKNDSSYRYTYSSKSSKKKSKTSNSKATSKKISSKSPTLKSTSKGASSTHIKTVLKEAEKYKGTPYKYGGNTSRGIDCSGLVCVAFEKINVKLPRRSVEMSNQGNTVKVSHVKEGDLLFFATGGGSINHVGIVYNINKSGEISFIHASTSKGVTISSLEESYWKGKFVKAKRVL